MNQFKKAKQLRNETGQAIESITDLKTAGVTQKAENTTTEEKKIQQNNADTNIQSDYSVETKNNAVQTNIESTAADINTNTNESIKNDVNPITETKTNESVFSTTAMSTPVVLEQPETKPTETITYNQPVIQTEAAVTKQLETSNENIRENIIPVTTPEVLNAYDIPTTIPQVVSTPAPVVSQPVISPYIAQTEYNGSQTIQQPYIEPQSSQEVTVIKHNKSSKKSVPNIFAPKGEAKSMRKSLVLKPTSVKIAENYCEKNGGSFNELIQTLLDNFIDEYGL